MNTGNSHFDSWYNQLLKCYERLNGAPLEKEALLTPELILSAYFRRLTSAEAAKILFNAFQLGIAPNWKSVRPKLSACSEEPLQEEEEDPEAECIVTITSPHFSGPLSLSCAYRDVEEKVLKLADELKDNGVAEFYIRVRALRAKDKA